MDDERTEDEKELDDLDFPGVKKGDSLKHDFDDADVAEDDLVGEEDLSGDESLEKLQEEEDLEDDYDESEEDGW